MTKLTGFVGLAAALLIGGCAGGAASNGSGRSAGQPGNTDSSVPFDSATVMLWRFDETVGTRISSEGGRDVGGTAGTDTRLDLGRIGGARRFTRSIDSFIWSPHHPALQISAELTVEAWIRMEAFGQYEDTPIVSRWNSFNADQSWFLAVGGLNIQAPLATLPSPGYHNGLIPPGFQGRSLARLMFAFQPERAGPPRAFFSNERIELNRWTHVAVTFDSKVVRLFINGQLDAQFAVSDGIRAGEAPLLLGNVFDPRSLTSFGGELRVGSEVDRNPYYAFEGLIDELRLSNVARSEFPYVR
ncbi:MAG: LamG domain-containing protein [Candidatus Eisenbacteria bacterium]